MKSATMLMTIIITIAALTGCAGTPRVIESKLSERAKGVFNEWKENDTLMPGESVLSINVSFKTHADDISYFYLESKKNPHGKPSYRVLVNIDGQPVVWTIQGARESKPVYNEAGKRIPDPEAGDGVLYILDKKLLISPGKHRVFFSLPDDGYFKDFEIYVQKGDENYLELKPVYHFLHPPLPRWIRSFKNEIDSFKAYYNAVCCAD